MVMWDILLSRSMKVERSVSEADVIAGLTHGRYTRDDCARKTGDDHWFRISEITVFRPDAAEALAAEEPPQIEGSLRAILADAEPAQKPAVARTRPAVPAPILKPAPPVAAAASPTATDVAVAPPEDEDSGEIPFHKKHHEEEEELDMTPLVDVAMQLILFFMVTSTMILQSCLEFPAPPPEDSKSAQAPPKIPTLDDLKIKNIMVKVKADNSIWIDEDKSPTKEAELRNKLENVKRTRSVEGGILIVTEEAAYHQTTVTVMDAANLADIKPIKIGAPKKDTKQSTTKKRTVKTG